ncbi:hypothetical protein FRX31_022746 [Thalictrum thalictroides]|uniref:CRAL-TRIO domain-containing protein n=1 Tax=Thalictrum thalictroides TaxID=46969 RepID=A0A7J6VSG0_THATH|nr:hypothetical protein FRX31_022746 [Thalictrum thalictroides]
MGLAYGYLTNPVVLGQPAVRPLKLPPLVRQKMSCGQEQFSAIVDLKGWGFSKLDLNASPSSMLSILQEYYPETVGQIYI